MQKLNNQSFILWVLFLGACEEPRERAIDSKTIAQEIKARKPQQITPPKMLEWARLKGQLITRIGQKNLFRSVSQAIDNQSIKSNTEFYKVQKIAELDSLAKVYGVKIKKIAFDNPEKIDLSQEEKQILQDYQQDKLGMEEQAKLLNDSVLYTNPIMFDNQIVGMWSIIFPKTEIVKLYDYKDLR